MSSEILFPEAKPTTMMDLYDTLDEQEQESFLAGLNPFHRVINEKGTRRFKIEPLDPDRLIKVNNLKEITNPTFFKGNNIPTSDGLLSNEIFGYTKQDRGNTFAYISLDEWFLHPLHYRVWCKIDNKLPSLIHETAAFSIVNGKLEKDPSGNTGIKWLKANIDKINFNNYPTKQRDIVEFLEKFRSTMFIRNFIIIPAYYRDVNTSNGYVGVGEINQLYASLIIAVRALRESKDYGLTLSGATRGRIQEILLNIYRWFGTGATSTGEKDGVGISGKYGVMRRSNLNKTTDYSCRLVISCPNLRCEDLDDMMVDTDHAALPLAAACVNFFPYIMYWLRKFFENEFSGSPYYTYIDKKGKVNKVKLKDYRIEFSDERIKKEIDRFVHGFSNRFITISIPNEERKQINMRFKGYKASAKSFKDGTTPPASSTMINRDLTWCDLFYMAACEVTEDKTILVTRYPMDSYFNQFPSKVRISSTKETEPMIVNGKLYKWYPKITPDIIGVNTSSLFVDTLNMSNTFLKAIGGDYDGDQVSTKPIYSVEANAELEKMINSKANYISLGAGGVRVTTNEGIQVLYNLTIQLPDSNLGAPKFKK